MLKVAIIGPGAIGGVIAGWLTHAGNCDLVLCARTPFERLTVETPGRTIDVSPRVLVEPARGHLVDWILLATKTYDVDQAAAWFPSLCGPHTRVAVLQNGVEHVERLRPHLPEEAIVPVVIDCPAERVGPGRIRQRGAASLVVRDDSAGCELAALFTGLPFTVTLTNDFKTAAWRKLCLNTAGVVPAILGKGDGVSRHDAIADLMRALVREAIVVGRAEGAVLADDLAEQVVASCRRAPVDGVNSLNADRRAGRRTEIDARNGAIVRFGKKHGIETPYNSMAVALMSA